MDVSSSARLEERLEEELRLRAERCRELAAEVHRDPELGCREYHAVTRLTGELEEEGFEVETAIGGLPTAFRATRGEGGPCIAFLAEYDALPGLGHGCGHNLIVAASCTAAAALGALVEGLGGRVALIGAPAEETIGGKVVLAVRGAFDDVDAALLAHPGSDDAAAVDSLASWSMEVTFYGRAAHAVASPEKGINALDGVIQLFVARDMLLKALRPGVRMPGVILEGGVRPNVIPDRARARFSLRAADSVYLVQTVVPRFRELAQGIATATGTRVEVTPVDNLYDEMVSNPVLVESWLRRARQAGLNPRPAGGRVIGSLDMGTLSQQIPALHPVFPIADPSVASHTAEFTRLAGTPPAFEAAQRAARALALTGFDLLSDPERLARARSEHRRLIAGRPPRPEAPVITEAEGRA